MLCCCCLRKNAVCVCVCVCVCEREREREGEREREREEKARGGVGTDSTVLGGGDHRNKICGSEGSQAVPASPSGIGEDCMRDFKEVGEAAMGRTLVWHWEGYIRARFWKVSIWRAAWEACSATWNLGNNSAFALGPRETTENLDRFGKFPLEDGHKAETCSGYWIKYSNQCCVRRKPWTWMS
jgi:hypothetical protein